jgi:hypothetical protein
LKSRDGKMAAGRHFEIIASRSVAADHVDWAWRSHIIVWFQWRSTSMLVASKRGATPLLKIIDAAPLRRVSWKDLDALLKVRIM